MLKILSKANEHEIQPTNEIGKNQNSDIEFLKHVPIFAGLSDEQIEKLLKIIERKKFEKDEIIIREGEVGDSMYILEQGAAEVSKSLTLMLTRHDIGQRDKTLSRLDDKTHAVFGDMSMFDKNSERSATVTALTESTLLVIHKIPFEKLCEEDPLLGYQVVRNIAVQLCSRLSKMNKDCMKLTTALSLALSRR